MFKRVLFTSTLLVLTRASFAEGVAGPPAPDPQRDEVNQQWASCVALREGATARRVWVANASVPWESAARWQKVPDRPTAEKHVQFAELRFDAGNNLIAVEERESSQSGDHWWRVDYCFRPNGTMAFLMRTFWTSQGGVKQERRIWVGSSGKRLDDQTQVFDLDGDQPLRKGTRDYFDPDAMGWSTLPSPLEAFSAKKYLTKFPKGVIAPR